MAESTTAQPKEFPEPEWKSWDVDEKTQRPVDPTVGIPISKNKLKKFRKDYAYQKKNWGKAPKSAKQQKKRITDEDVSKWHTLNKDLMERQPTMNIMTIGHVAHGKSTLMKALSGESTQRSKREKAQNMTIKLGYASCKIYKCENPKCPRPQCYKYTGSEQKICFCLEGDCALVNEGEGNPCELVRHLSFVDCPGHHSLMGTMLSGASVVDGAVMVVAANTTCPSPQTAEHMAAAKLLGMADSMVVAQNKVDLVTKDKCAQNSYEIQKFLEYFDVQAPVTPICANLKYNVDAFCMSVCTRMPVPKRDMLADLRLCIIRSFDVNKPGVSPDELMGGVAGGTVLQGVIRVGQNVEIRPGIIRKGENGRSGTVTPIVSKVISIYNNKQTLDIAAPGGNVGVGLTVDPFITRNNNIVGHLMGARDKLPPVFMMCMIRYTLMGRSVTNQSKKGTKGKSKSQSKIGDLTKDEVVLLNIGSMKCTGKVIKMNVKLKMQDINSDKKVQVGGKALDKRTFTCELDWAVCAPVGAMVAISRKEATEDAWRLVGSGTVLGFIPVPLTKMRVAGDDDEKADA